MARYVVFVALRRHAIFDAVQVRNWIEKSRPIQPPRYSARKPQIGATGFEPAAFWTQTRRSSQAELRPVASHSYHQDGCTANKVHPPTDPHQGNRMFARVRRVLGLRPR